MKKLSKTKKKKYFNNTLKFTAPGLAVFFAQLALGAEPKVAGLTGLVVLYGNASDFFNKVK